MLVKELKDFIKDLPDDMEIVIEGEYNRGVPPIDKLKVAKRVWDDNYYDKDEKRNAEQCLIISIDEYLAETEDLGDKELYLTTNEYNDIFNQNITEVDEDDEFDDGYNDNDEENE